MMNVSLGLLLIVLAIVSIPIVLGFFLAAYLWEQAHGGAPVKLTRGFNLDELLA
jgi:uncharacterized protein YneF (UPF0154 family)